MNILKESNYNVIEFLGGYQKRYMNLKYRFMKGLITTNYQDRIILYNTLTGAVVSLFDFEYNNINTELSCDYSNFLYGNYFLVREDFDENKIIDDYRKLHTKYISPTYLDRPNHYTILTTSKCNARCNYCYERLLPNKQHMSDEVAMNVAKYIINNSEINNPITIEWFGGEPLYNSKAIDIISSTICSAGLDFSSTMISNGYLFNDDLINKASNMWHLNNVQITLDGTEENYNKIKNYIYKDNQSPFKTIINNIHKLLKRNIGVTIRLNCNKENYENLIELIKYLKQEFTGYGNISVYVWEIFSENLRTEEGAYDMFTSLNKVDEALCESGMNVPCIENGIKAYHCVVDGGQGVNINVNGKLFLCEHYIDNDFFGDIYHPEIKDFDNFVRWRDYVDSHDEKCINCPIRAICLKMHRCTDQHKCVGYEQQYRIDKVKRHLTILQDNFNTQFCDQDKCCIQN